MEFFSNAMKNIVTSKDEDGHSNILETNHHLKPHFEKIDTTRYFRFLVRSLLLIIYCFMPFCLFDFSDNDNAYN